MAKLIIEVEPKFTSSLDFNYTTVGEVAGTKYHGDVVKENILNWYADREAARLDCINKLVDSYRGLLEKIYNEETDNE